MLHCLIGVAFAATLVEPATPELGALLESARARSSDTLWVSQGGEVVLDWHVGREGRLLQVNSVTKVFASMALGMLVDEGLVDSVDDPVARYVTRLEGSPAEAVTLRQVLGHNSGLYPMNDPEEDPSRKEMRRDLVGFAAAQPLLTPPGQRWAYNNTAVNLLSATVNAVTGGSMEQLLEERLFGPLGIRRYALLTDREGVTQAHRGLAMWKSDLGRVGQMLLDGGVWEGERILSEDWLRRSTAPQERFPWSAWQWWPVHGVSTTLSPELLDFWALRGVSEPVVEAARARIGGCWESPWALKTALEADLGEEAWRVHAEVTFRGLPVGHVERPVLGYEARGAFGQFLTVLPEAGVVGVRQWAAGFYVSPGTSVETAGEWTGFGGELAKAVGMTGCPG